jgi:hypothetical protein
MDEYDPARHPLWVPEPDQPPDRRPGPKVPFLGPQEEVPLNHVELVLNETSVDIIGRDSEGRFFDLHLDAGAALALATDLAYWSAGDFDQDDPIR